MFTNTGAILNCFQRFFPNRKPKEGGRVGYTNLHTIVKKFLKMLVEKRLKN